MSIFKSGLESEIIIKFKAQPNKMKSIQQFDELLTDNAIIDIIYSYQNKIPLTPIEETPEQEFFTSILNKKTTKSIFKVTKSKRRRRTKAEMRFQ